MVRPSGPAAREFPLFLIACKQRMTKLAIFQLSIAIPGQLRSVARAIYAVELLN